MGWVAERQGKGEGFGGCGLVAEVGVGVEVLVAGADAVNFLSRISASRELCRGDRMRGKSVDIVTAHLFEEFVATYP